MQIVVLIIIGDLFSHKLHKFINIHVRDVPVAQNINCIVTVVIDSYGLWINRLQMIIFSTNTLWEDWLLLLKWLLAIFFRQTFHKFIDVKNFPVHKY